MMQRLQPLCHSSLKTKHAPSLSFLRFSDWIFYPLPMDGVARICPNYLIQEQTSSGYQAVVREAEGRFFATFFNQQKRGLRGRFVREGGIGKLSVLSLSLAFLLGFFGQLIFGGLWLSSVVWILIGISLVLAIIGRLVGGKNNAISKGILWLFAFVSGIYVVAIGFLFLAYKLGWIGD